MTEKWTPTPIRVAREFLYGYSQDLLTFHSCARASEDLIRSVLKPENLAIHQVSARAKALDSMRLKLRRKCYSDPDAQVQDKIGVRVITYYAEDVDRVAEVLKSEFEIDPKNSEDKRTVLEEDVFGYRSVHLIARLKGSRLRSPEYSMLRDRWLEIQVRSLLEHAWAEIEHEVKYKPRIDYPAGVRRRFARIAGVLEMLDTEFQELRRERETLIDNYRRRYLRRTDDDIPFDTARLLGFLEAVRPEGLSWRGASTVHKPFPLHIEASCVDTLNAIKLDTPKKLRKALQDRRVKDQCRRFAQIADVEPSEISHLAIILLLVLALSPARLMDLFPMEACNSTEFREMRRTD